jgi:hypothetical protein
MERHNKAGATSQVVAHVERARTSIKSVHAENVSVDGVFFHPQMTLVSLKIAREELNRAIVLMEHARWTR